MKEFEWFEWFEWFGPSPIEPFNSGANFKPALEKHLEGAMKHLTKLEGFCAGPFMCGGAMQSGDFHVFEMLEQHPKKDLTLS